MASEDKQSDSGNSIFAAEAGDQHAEKQGTFTSKLGFVLAAAGSAVGLGNIWRFPYLSAKYGGGIFLFTYLILVLTFGYALLISENCLGRSTRKGPIGTYNHYCAGKKGFLGFVRIGGWINSIVPIIIVPYYCVIGGWVTKYVFAMLCNPVSIFAKDHLVGDGDNKVPFAAQYFGNFVSSTWEPIFYFLLFGAIMVAVVAFGIEKGIERFNKVAMPLLLIIIIGICVKCFTLPNSGEGFAYYLKPDFSKFSYMTVVAAMGQLFFSLSIAMGIMITYGSYMRKEDNLVSSVNQVELWDTCVAFLAGLMIIPAVVCFGGKEAAEAAGPGLVFVTMPQVFASFATGGRFIGVMFFLLVLFAAATSAVSLLETNVQSIAQEFNLKRKNSIIYGMIEVLCVGIITILGYSVFKNFHPLAFIERYKGFDILDSLDFISNNFLMPLAAIFTTILVVAVIGLEKFGNQIQEGAPKWYRRWVYELCMSVIVIPCLLVILLNSLGIIQ
jgi:neurotransmitter:Na+ symporter, NSS family